MQTSLACAEEGQHLIVRAKHETILKLFKRKGMKTLPELIVDDKSIEQPLKGELLVEVVGAPLQLIMTICVPLLVRIFWGF